MLGLLFARWGSQLLVRQLSTSTNRVFLDLGLDWKVLGFTTLTCGCVSGRYREMGTNREITYIEEKGSDCSLPGHQRNQLVSPDRVAHGFNSGAVKAS